MLRLPAFSVLHLTCQSALERGVEVEFVVVSERLIWIISSLAQGHAAPALD